jgi:hypothetical protein
MLTLKRFVWASAVLAVLFVVTGAYKTGAPNAACLTLTPKHKNWTSQTTPSPYKITAKRSGDTVDVTISGADKFKGFLLVGRAGKSETNVGQWLPVENAKLVKCSAENVRIHFLPLLMIFFINC